MSDYDFEKLGKEMASAFKGAEDAADRAGELARTLAAKAVSSTRGKQDPKITVAAACRGVMAGVVLNEGDLPKSAVAILQKMAAVAQESNLDPAECMTWAMEGIAPVCKLAPGAAADNVRLAIEEHFMGAGEVFSSILQTAGA